MVHPHHTRQHTKPNLRNLEPRASFETGQPSENARKNWMSHHLNAWAQVELYPVESRCLFSRVLRREREQNNVKKQYCDIRSVNIDSGKYLNY